MKQTHYQFMRFVVVGIINTLVYYFFYRALLLVMPYLQAHVLAFLISAFNSYFLTTYFTFKTRPTFHTFIRFPLTFLPNLLLSSTGTKIIVSTGLMNEKYASLFMMIIIIPITFIINKLIFRSKHEHKK